MKEWERVCVCKREERECVYAACIICISEWEREWVEEYERVCGWDTSKAATQIRKIDWEEDCISFVYFLSFRLSTFTWFFFCSRFIDFPDFVFTFFKKNKSFCVVLDFFLLCYIFSSFRYGPAKQKIFWVSPNKNN